MLANSQALAEIAAGNDGVMQGIRKGCTHVDMSTVSPLTTKQLGVEYQKQGCFFMHSPVLGSVPQATDGSLLLFVGGSDEAFLTARRGVEIFSAEKSGDLKGRNRPRTQNCFVIYSSARWERRLLKRLCLHKRQKSIRRPCLTSQSLFVERADVPNKRKFNARPEFFSPILRRAHVEGY